MLFFAITVFAIIDDLWSIDARNAGSFPPRNTSLALRDAVTGALAASGFPGSGRPRYSPRVCTTFGWQTGSLWTVEPHLDQLACVSAWHISALSGSEFEAATRNRTFALGAGMPGRCGPAANRSGSRPLHRRNVFACAVLEHTDSTLASPSHRGGRHGRGGHGILSREFAGPIRS